MIGTMAELGEHSKKQHRRAGKAIASVCDELVTVGKEAMHVAKGAIDNGMDEGNIFQYESPRLAGKELELRLKKGDVILVKGSQSARVEKVVEEIMAEPEKKNVLLTRQDDYWLSR